jgi:hypothetical protein
MRVLRILTSSTLPCGCLIGIYELYNGQTIAIVDAPACDRAEHRAGQQVDEVPGIAELGSRPRARD